MLDRLSITEGGIARQIHLIAFIRHPSGLQQEWLRGLDTCQPSRVCFFITPVSFRKWAADWKRVDPKELVNVCK